MTTEQTERVVRAYYESWRRGRDGVDEAALGAVLAPEMTLETPLGSRNGSAVVTAAIARFATTVKAFRPFGFVCSGDEAAAVYDCDTSVPEGTLRCAEFFRVEGGRIAAIRLVFDATEYRKTAPGRT